MSNYIYCIYTGKEIPIDKANSEHIIPLSLGGVNGFEILVDADFNAELGSKIDGKLANDFLIMIDRKKKNVRGHSRKDVDMRWKKSLFKDSQEPVQIEFINYGTKVYPKIYSPIKRTYLDAEEIGDRLIESQIVMDRFIRLKFSAKTALSAGYYVYEDLFKKHVDLESLRALMTMNKSNMDEVLSHSKLRVADQFSYPLCNQKEQLDVMMFKKMCENFDSSCVMFILSTNNIIITIGILGEYIATINVPAETHLFPNEDKYRLGHVVFLQNGKIKRQSFHSAVGELMKKIEQHIHVR